MGWSGRGDVFFFCRFRFHQLLSDFMYWYHMKTRICWNIIIFIGLSSSNIIEKHRKHMKSSIIALSFFHLKGSRVGFDIMMGSIQSAK